MVVKIVGDKMNALDKANIIQNKLEVSLCLFNQIASIWNLDKEDIKNMETNLNKIITDKYPEGVL